VVEQRQIDLGSAVPPERHPVDPLLEFNRIWNPKTHLREDLAQPIDVISNHPSTEEGCFDKGRPPPHKWVVHNVGRPREPFDEEASELRCEACPVGDLVQ